MNLKTIFYYVGLFCFPISALSLINILYSSYFDYFLNLNAYLITLFISLTIGILFYLIGKNSEKRINFYEQILLIIFSYLLVSTLISLPYFFSIYQFSFLDSLFESFSGVTLTGFTIFDNVKHIDPTLILWRSSSQWIGGLYFLFFLIIIFSNKQFMYKLNNLTFCGEASNIESNIKNSLFKISICYFVLSILIIFLLLAADIRLFNALNLSMTIVSTGGFLPTNSLSQIISTPIQEFNLIICFLLSCLNIFLILNIFSLKKMVASHREDIFLVFFIILFLIPLFLILKDYETKEIILSVLSSITNSGIAITKIPENISLFFLLLAVVGGSLISNTSGIKLMRIYILLKSSSSEILKLVRPNNVINQNILFSEKKITNEYIKICFLIFISFFISLFILSGVLILDNINFEKTFKLSLLTLTNTTNSELYGMSNINFTNLLTSSKISIIIFMIVGKIELISIFLIIKKFFFTN